MSANTSAIFAGKKTLLLTDEGLRLRSGAVIDNDGEFNPITNGHFELVVSPWITYQNAPGAVPVDGTGGTPSTTIVRSLATPLQGAASGLFSKGALNHQGEGLSYTFDVPLAWKNRLIRIEFDYDATANYNATTETLDVFIFDVTNSTLITPFNTRVAAGAGKFVADFQNSTGSQLRLCIHISGTGATNWDLKIDNVRVLRTENASFTANRSLISDNNGSPTASAVTSTEIGYVSGVTSSIQTQFTGVQTQFTALYALNSTVAVAGNVTLTNKAIHIVDTTAARSLALPDPATTKVVVIKDSSGQSESNPITVTRFAAENIEGAAASYTLDSNYGSWTIISDGTNWWLV